MVRDWAQLAFFAAWLVVLVRFHPLRDLVRRTPRRLTWPIAGFVIAWTLTQLTDQRRAFFPLVSVPMYGEYRPQEHIQGIIAVGRWCDGTAGDLDLDFLGRAGLRGRLGTLHSTLRYYRTAADSQARWDLLERTLLAIAGTHNRAFPDNPLCGIGLREVRIRTESHASGLFPASRIVRDVPIR